MQICFLPVVCEFNFGNNFTEIAIVRYTKGNKYNDQIPMQTYVGLRTRSYT